jgi:hypothetical protein
MVYYIKQTKTLTENHIMTTQTASAPTAKFINWNKAIQVKNGFLPADLSVALGSEKLQTVWLNVRKRTIAEVANEVKALWIEAVAIEKGLDITTATKRVEDYIARYDNPVNWICIEADGSWVMPGDPMFASTPQTEVATEVAEVEPLTEKEVKNAKKVKKLIKSDPVNEQIFWYIIQNRPIHSVGFCKTAGIDTRTMQARARTIQSAIKDSLKNETVAAHLIRIMGIESKTEGGWLKTR